MFANFKFRSRCRAARIRLLSAVPARIHLALMTVGHSRAMSVGQIRIEEEPTMTETTMTDPVCGMQVDPELALAVDYAGDVYYFCEAVCADTFRDEPARWIPQVVTLEG